MHIRTSNWGPYSTQLPSISRIHDGDKFTIAVSPGIMSGHRPVVSLAQASGDFEILDALPDLTYYRHRYHIGVGRKLCADVEFFTLSSQSAAIVVEYENTGAVPWNVETFSICQPESQQCPPALSCPAGAVVLDAADYDKLESAKAGWVLDWRDGVHPAAGATNGNALIWGAESIYRGAFVRWKLPEGLKGNYNLYARYLHSGQNAVLVVKGVGSNLTIPIETTLSEYRFSAPQAVLLDGQTEITLEHPKLTPLELDCLVLTPQGAEPPKLAPPPMPPRLECMKTDHQASITTMKSCPRGDWYCLWSSNARKNNGAIGPRLRHYALPYGDMRRAANFISTANLLGGNAPVAAVVCVGNQFRTLGAKRKLKELMIVSTGRSEQAAIDQIGAEREHVDGRIAELRRKYARHIKIFTGPTQVASFAKRLSAQTLTNINYPGLLGKRRQHKVCYYTPAKHYGTFYLWDMGMTGIGMSSVAPDQASDLFRQYFPADDCVPFLAWGTMLPCHVFMYWNYYQVTRDRAFLSDNFHLAMRMYNFFAGHDKRSRIRDAATGLLSNYGYFCNAGGWDDYPAQQRYHQIGSNRIFPVVCTAQTVIAAKMLRLAALALDKKAEYKSLCADIEQLENLLYKHHWNEQEGLFSYYDDRDPHNRFMTIDGEEANKGLDGLFGLASGSLKPEHVELFVKTITDPARFLSPFGLTTVDMTAGYYKPGGYWNGHVWAPPSWFFFRGLLNYGRVSQAKTLASRVIRSFMKASATHGYIVECVDNRLGHPEHVPYFSGLTAPLLDLIGSLYGPRSTTTGPDVDAELSRTKLGWNLKVTSPTHRGWTGILLTLDANRRYAMKPSGGSMVQIKSDAYGKAWLRLDLHSDRTDVTITPAEASKP